MAFWFQNLFSFSNSYLFFCLDKFIDDKLHINIAKISTNEQKMSFKESVSDLLKRGQILHDENRYDEAIKTFKEALLQEPDNTDILIRIGLSHRYKEEYDEAIDYYNKALEIEPDNKTALNNVGYAYECKEEVDKAIDYYVKSLELDPAYELPLVNLTTIYNNREEYQKSVDLLKRALEIDSINSANWIDLGLAYRYLEEYDDAIESYLTALKFDPNNELAHNNIGYAYYLKKEYLKAIKYLKRSLKLDWKYDLPYSNLNTIYNALLDEKIEDCSIWKQMAETYYVGRDYRKALNCCNKVIEIDEDYEDIKELRVKVLNAKRIIEKRSVLENNIDMALNFFYNISLSVEIEDLINYIKFKNDTLEFDDNEIKFRVFERLGNQKFRTELDGTRLVFIKEDHSSGNQLLV